jgi:hypothetical protein
MLAAGLVNRIVCSAKQQGISSALRSGFYSSFVILNFKKTRQGLGVGMICCFSSLFCEDLRVRKI